VQAFFGGHRGRQHVQADGAGQLTLEASGRHRNLRVVGDGLLRRPVQLVEREIPRFFHNFVRSHFFERFVTFQEGRGRTLEFTLDLKKKKNVVLTVQMKLL
jgi:hypothetical protein